MRCQGGQNQTCDATGTWQNAGTSVLQLLQNPNFDQGAVSWTQLGGLPGYPLITTLAGLPLVAHTGQYVLWEGGYDDAEDDAYQTLTIPTGATAITLSFYYLIQTEEIGYAYDGMAAYISDAGTNILNPLVELTNLDQTTAWTKVTVQVPLTWAGRSVEVGFLTVGDGYYVTSFFVDTVSLNATACPVAGGTGGF
jgi:hypothetical protein